MQKVFFNNTSPPCTPCVCSNQLHFTTNPFNEHDLKEKCSGDKSEQISVSPKMYNSQYSEELDYINPIIRQLKSKVEE